MFDEEEQHQTVKLSNTCAAFTAYEKWVQGAKIRALYKEESSMKRLHLQISILSGVKVPIDVWRKKVSVLRLFYSGVLCR